MPDTKAKHPLVLLDFNTTIFNKHPNAAKLFDFAFLTLIRAGVIVVFNPAGKLNESRFKALFPESYKLSVEKHMRTLGSEINSLETALAECSTKFKNSKKQAIKEEDILIFDGKMPGCSVRFEAFGELSDSDEVFNSIRHDLLLFLFNTFPYGNHVSAFIVAGAFHGSTFGFSFYEHFTRSHPLLSIHKLFSRVHSRLSSHEAITAETLHIDNFSFKDLCDYLDSQYLDYNKEAVSLFQFICKMNQWSTEGNAYLSGKGGGFLKSTTAATHNTTDAGFQSCMESLVGKFSAVLERQLPYLQECDSNEKPLISIDAFRLLLQQLAEALTTLTPAQIAQVTQSFSQSYSNFNCEPNPDAIKDDFYRHFAEKALIDAFFKYYDGHILPGDLLELLVKTLRSIFVGDKASSTAINAFAIHFFNSAESLRLLNTLYKNLSSEGKSQGEAQLKRQHFLEKFETDSNRHKGVLDDYQAYFSQERRHKEELGESQGETLVADKRAGEFKRVSIILASGGTASFFVATGAWGWGIYSLLNGIGYEIIWGAGLPGSVLAGALASGTAWAATTKTAKRVAGKAWSALTSGCSSFFPREDSYQTLGGDLEHGEEEMAGPTRGELDTDYTPPPPPSSSAAGT
jgi:hypothetical protein